MFDVPELNHSADTLMVEFGVVPSSAVSLVVLSVVWIKLAWAIYLSWKSTVTPLNIALLGTPIYRLPVYPGLASWYFINQSLIASNNIALFMLYGILSILFMSTSPSDELIKCNKQKKLSSVLLISSPLIVCVSFFKNKKQLAFNISFFNFFSIRF